MDKQRRRDLKRQFAEVKTYMGVYAIKNLDDGRIYLAASPNLKNLELRMRMSLDGAAYPCPELQRDWKRLGSEYFSIEILEQQSDEDVTDKKFELSQMLKRWLAKLEPYGDAGYNRPLE